MTPPTSSDAIYLPVTKGVVVEAEYAGIYPYPSSNTVHGFLLGGSYYFNRYVGTELQMGWMGIRKGSGVNGDISNNYFPVLLGLKISFPMGSGMFSVVPAAKLDLLLTKKEPVKSSSHNSFGAEFSFGGKLLWNLPVSSRPVDIVIGAAVFATMASKDMSISDEIILKATTFQLMWVAGAAFDFRRR